MKHEYILAENAPDLPKDDPNEIASCLELLKEVPQGEVVAFTPEEEETTYKIKVLVSRAAAVGNLRLDIWEQDGAVYARDRSPKKEASGS